MNLSDFSSMDRKDFIRLAGLGAIATAGCMTLKKFGEETVQLKDSDETMPALFIGHGSPMNAIEDNSFTKALEKTGKDLPKPKAILCVSAHWLTRGNSKVLSAEKPKMIYDMYGFPDELYKVNYPAPGAPEFAKAVSATVKKTHIETTDEWGFDHGNWSVMKHLFPGADIPVFQLSIDYNKDARWHYELAQELAVLRKKGVLIIGSGNMTHNLGRVDFSGENAPVMDWASEFDSKMKGYIDSHDHAGVYNYLSLGTVAKMAHPEPSHFFPLLYTLGLQGKDEAVTYTHEGIVYGSLSMRCIKIG